MPSSISSRTLSALEEPLVPSPGTGPSSRPYSPLPTPVPSSGNKLLADQRSLSLRHNHSTSPLYSASPTYRLRPATLAGSGIWSHARTPTTERFPSDLDNWQSLQELVGEDQDGDAVAGPLLRMCSSPQISSSHRNLRSLFSMADNLPVAASIAVDIAAQPRGPERAMRGLLSTSPPLMEGVHGVSWNEGVGDEGDLRKLPEEASGLNEHLTHCTDVPLLSEHHRPVRTASSSPHGK